MLNDMLVGSLERCNPNGIKLVKPDNEWSSRLFVTNSKANTHVRRAVYYLRHCCFFLVYERLHLQ